MPRFFSSRVAVALLLVISAYYLLPRGFWSSHGPLRKSSKGLPYHTSRWSSPDGSIQHYVIERTASRYNSPQSVLFLTITANNESWGRNPAEEARSVYSYLDLVTNTTLRPEQTSIGLLTSSPAEYERFVEILTPPVSVDERSNGSNAKRFDYRFSRVVLVLHTAATRAPPNDTDPSVQSRDQSRENRHNIPQHERRAILAKLRNYLTWAALRHETHVAWLDADVYKYSSNRMIEAMMERTRTTAEAEVGILTARCRVGEPEKAEAWIAAHPDYENGGVEHEMIAHKTHASGNYDRNAWLGTRTSPNAEEQARLWKDVSDWTPMHKDVLFVDALISNTNDDDIKRVDSIGGTILMLSADLIRMGLVWPTGYFVGMTFEHGEGYDGIESEGLCLLTRSFSRDGQTMCFTMGGEWSVWHTVF